MDFQSSPLPHDIYLDPPPPPPQWSQQQEGGCVDIVQDHEHGSVDRPAGSMVVRARLAKLPPPEVALKCPRCESTNTKFCYFNNYSLSQPRHFCKTCRRYWTRGGALRNVPVGGGCRRSNKKNSKRKRGSKSPLTISKPISISSNTCSARGIFENFLTQTHPPHLPILHPNLPDPLSDQYSLQADIYGQAAAAAAGLGMGSGAVGLILENRFHNIQQWRGPTQGHDHQFPYMAAGLDPNQLASSTTTTTTYNHPSEIVDRHPLMKVELGNLGLNLLGNNDHENIGNDHDHDHLDQYWEGGNHNIISTNNIINIASSAWTDHLSRFDTSSSTPTTHLL